MSILIIGSDGYLGKSLKKYLKKKKKFFYEEKYKNFLNQSIDLYKYKKKIKIIIHFAITNDLGLLYNINKDINFANELSKFCKINKINLVFISSISAFKNNNSKYGTLKFEIEKNIVKFGATIIRPGMVWDFHPGSWFRRIEKLVDRFLFFMPLLGVENKPVYLVYKNDLIEKIFYILEKSTKYSRKSKIYIVANNNTYSLKEIVYYLAKKKNKFFFFIPIPFFILKLCIKLLVLLKIVDYNFYDSCLSYQYNKLHRFKDCILINTNEDYKNISKK